MAEVVAWAMASTGIWKDDWLASAIYLGAVPVGRSLVGVTNWADVPIQVGSVCRSDYGRDFRDLPEPLEISPDRTGWIDLDALPPRWPVVDPDMDYKLVSVFSMWSPDGVHWHFGTPDDDLGPIVVRPALHDLDLRRAGWKWTW